MGELADSDEALAVDDGDSKEVPLKPLPIDDSTIGDAVASGVEVPDSDMRWYE